ncbi:MAG TPA: hypothetical protein VFQ61_06410 [Polyangiaceae bacterium]|nr:hypothetical protein [Polyangiaceae bacterium]
MIHLRQLDGAPPPHREFPEASHEFAIFAIDPSCYESIGSGEMKLVLLQPPDCIEQFTVQSDDDAGLLLREAVSAMTHGCISPDIDAREQWQGFVRMISLTVDKLRTLPENCGC